MKTKSGLFAILSILLLSSIGVLTIDTAFAQDSEDKNEKSNDREEDKSQKNEEKRLENEKRIEEKRKELEEKRLENEKRIEEKRAELKDKKLENEKRIEEKLQETEEKRLEKEKMREEKRKELEEKRLENEKRIEEKRKELEEKREELESDREKLKEKLSERTEKYEEKLKEIKEKYQNQIDKLSEKNLQSLQKFEEVKEKIEEKSEKIKERLDAKAEKLDTRTQKLLEKIDDGDYMGKKIGSSKTTDTYELVFNSITASAISDKSQISSMTGKMTFTTFDSSKSNLKLELESCSISVDEIPYACGFGKARTVSSGDSGAKDSLVIIAFLEDNLAEEVHSTLKIFVDSDIPINQIEQSEVSILGPQSKLSHLWFLDGSATLTKITSSDETSEDITDDVPQGNDISVTLEEEIGLTTP